VVQSAYPSGVLGLVAVRLVEELGRPVAVLEQAEEMSRGSVRVPQGYSAIEAVSACAEYLLRFGGHRGAAGFAIEAARIPAFSEELIAAFGRQDRPVPTGDELVADCRLRPTTVSEDLLDRLAMVGPFGQGAPEPLFECGPLIVREARVVKERHLRLKLWGEGRLLVGIGFNGAAEVPPVGSRIDALFRVRPNVWQGQRRAELGLDAWRPATT
jgi:single-stranded-DNA-specific exonuclease